MLGVSDGGHGVRCSVAGKQIPCRQRRSGPLLEMREKWRTPFVFRSWPKPRYLNSGGNGLLRAVDVAHPSTSAEIRIGSTKFHSTKAFRTRRVFLETRPRLFNKNVRIAQKRVKFPVLSQREQPRVGLQRIGFAARVGVIHDAFCFVRFTFKNSQ